ncbi:hypothetical protein Ga0123462_1886 [Mariprofundus ferrinatatus]|uniref:Uncharacterized protein n=1 Tax=Mariprofundus ferrinatatus TaxID=1921087 RepID=A0A2K8L5Y2_9PROT|nr:hypothetical protein [Mariprofundus ferrinatatus]ATX82728.1 hypothetical protein Ga0123462_1886 [Mariprofundus ferrinatatus]
MADTERPVFSPLISYVAISCALLIPVIVWPLQGMGDGSLEFEAVWLVTASVLLVCAVTADSILYHQPDSLWPYFATAWILSTSFFVSLALRAETGIYILASMFSLHAVRSGYRLWHDGNDWWLWPSCIRDAVAALTIFGWIIFFSRTPY